MICGALDEDKDLTHDVSGLTAAVEWRRQTHHSDDDVLHRHDDDFVSTQFHPLEVKMRMTYTADLNPPDADQSPCGAVIWSPIDVTPKKTGRDWAERPHHTMTSSSPQASLRRLQRNFLDDVDDDDDDDLVQLTDTENSTGTWTRHPHQYQLSRRAIIKWWRWVWTPAVTVTDVISITPCDDWNNKYERYFGPGSGSACICNSWPLYARWADQRAVTAVACTPAVYAN